MHHNGREWSVLSRSTNVTRFGQPQHFVIIVTRFLVTQYNLISRRLIYVVITCISTIIIIQMLCRYYLLLNYASVPLIKNYAFNFQQRAWCYVYFLYSILGNKRFCVKLRIGVRQQITNSIIKNWNRSEMSY